MLLHFLKQDTYVLFTIERPIVTRKSTVTELNFNKKNRVSFNFNLCFLICKWVYLAGFVRNRVFAGKCSFLFCFVCYVAH